MKFIQFLFLTIFIFCSDSVFAQNKFDNFLKPADSLDQNKLKILILAESALVTSGLIGLHQLWYKNDPKSDFHFINDNSEWLQMDKVGHVF